MRCYFHLRQGHHLRIADPVGVEAGDIAQARAETRAVLREMAAEMRRDPARWCGWSVEVTDASGTILFSAELDDEDF
ncbi:hypothetical protein OPKNFCMD_3572 [Methylobacterium crusticola]|uniref:DUF6894 domain-containing protein n=1 Tax=Methylobacterium crusticola TaxID=1697972 RepID=A0ABQ4R1T4_9HYPH|nr:hypothetical protein [Methylobacterium crusticola]GJD50824.1 hypothetical protein OPKNFCMD_3572 [Methylobacterium crusticola]